MKNYLLGIGFLILAFYLIWQQGSEQIDYADQRSTNQATSDSPYPIAEGNTSRSFSQGGQTPQDGESSTELFFESTKELGQEKLSPGLASELSSVTFSNHTGGIRSIQLHQSNRLNKAYDLNHTEEPLLGIAFEDSTEIFFQRPCLILEIFNSWSKLINGWFIVGNLNPTFASIESMNDPKMTGMFSSIVLFLLAYGMYPWPLSEFGCLWARASKSLVCIIHLIRRLPI